MAVHCMFTHAKMDFSVPVIGDTISLARLKDEIYNVKFRADLKNRRVKHQDRFDFRVYNSHMKEEITGAQTRIHSHSAVFVKRLPAYILSGLQQQPETLSSEPESSKPQETGSDDDGFGDDVYSTSASVSVPFVTSDDERPKVTRVVRKYSSAQSSAKSIAQVHDKAQIPLELVCYLCHDLMKDPVLIPCCCNCFCRNCVTTAIFEQKKCPKCGSSKCNVSNLLSNIRLDNTVHKKWKSHAFAIRSGNDISGVEALSSSSGSNGYEFSLLPTNVGGKRKMAPSTPLNGPKNAKPLCMSLTDRVKAAHGPQK